MLIWIVSSALFLVSCNHEKQGPTSGKPDLITERIQYDVDIKSPDPDFDWWVQNIEGLKRENFVHKILEMASSGKYRVYDYFNNPLSPAQVKNIGREVDSIQFQSPDPPYDVTDSVIIKNLDINEITRIKFLEEWSFVEGEQGIEKRVLGLAPMIKSYSEQGEFRGYSLLFWIYFDKGYPVK